METIFNRPLHGRVRGGDDGAIFKNGFSLTFLRSFPGVGVIMELYLKTNHFFSLFRQQGDDGALFKTCCVFTFLVVSCGRSHDGPTIFKNEFTY